ncbi:hypothetical protein CDAR_76751 [Caerostris darwini]|uniref:Uncharacterized protein n=1 Tax=Caerostris darwini TaxID=1538125 RepID=A0AAV4QHM1_9ARAC|nr:hypothetical protein CDAR_76751 [Caerostris darwini]
MTNTPPLEPRPQPHTTTATMVLFWSRFDTKILSTRKAIQPSRRRTPNSLLPRGWGGERHERKKKRDSPSKPLRKRMLLALIGQGLHVGLVIQLVINGTGGKQEDGTGEKEQKKKKKNEPNESPLEKCGNL